MFTVTAEPYESNCGEMWITVIRLLNQAALGFHTAIVDSSWKLIESVKYFMVVYWKIME